MATKLNAQTWRQSEMVPGHDDGEPDVEPPFRQQLGQAVREGLSTLANTHHKTCRCS